MDIARRRAFIAVVFLLVTLATLTGIVQHYTSRAVSAWFDIDQQYRHNLLHAHVPDWVKDYAFKHDDGASSLIKGVPAPSMIPSLLDAKWMGAWELPQLAKPVTCSEKTPDTPALLMLHFFSGAFPKSRGRRDLIRKLSPLNSVPPAFRHLVEVKFVLGRSHDPEVEKELDGEEGECGDLIRLDGLTDGENMDKGKTVNWIRWVGRPGGREAQWVMKCDEDTLPFLPNFLPFLLQHDPAKPTYVGTTMQRNPKFAAYMNGFFYGFSWGVVKTIATADLPLDVINGEWYEDARVGQLMYSLPSMPNQPHDPPAQEWTNASPPSPDPRTGLVRLDTGARMTDIWMWWGAPSYLAYAWHRMKGADDYENAYNRAVHEFADMGWKFEWKVPGQLSNLAASC